MQTRPPATQAFAVPGRDRLTDADGPWPGPYGERLRLLLAARTDGFQTTLADLGGTRR